MFLFMLFVAKTTEKNDTSIFATFPLENYVEN